MEIKALKRAYGHITRSQTKLKENAISLRHKDKIISTPYIQHFRSLPKYKGLFGMRGGERNFIPTREVGLKIRN